MVFRAEKNYKKTRRYEDIDFNLQFHPQLVF